MAAADDRRRAALDALRGPWERTLRAALKFSHIMAYFGAVLFILVCGYFNLIYTIKFEVPQAYAWLISSVLGTLQGWLLLEPVEISWASSKEHVRDALKTAYMDHGGGDRVQAGMFHMQQRVKQREEEKRKEKKSDF